MTNTGHGLKPGIIALRSDPEWIISHTCAYCGSGHRAWPEVPADPTDRNSPPKPDPKAWKWECGACRMPWLRIERIEKTT